MENEKINKTTTISLKIPTALKKKLEWLSELKNMSMSEYIRSLIEVEIPNSDAKPKSHPLSKYAGIFKVETSGDQEFVDFMDNIRKEYIPRKEGIYLKLFDKIKNIMYNYNISYLTYN